MKKMSLTLATTLVLALIAGSAFAWGPSEGGKMMRSGPRLGCPGYGYGYQTDQSQLTREQQEKLTALRQQYIDDTYELRSAQIVKRQQIRLLMETSNPDRAKLNGMYDELDNIKKQIRSKSLDFQFKAKKIAPDYNVSGVFGRRGRHMGHGGGGNGFLGAGAGYGNCFN